MVSLLLRAWILLEFLRENDSDPFAKAGLNYRLK